MFSYSGDTGRVAKDRDAGARFTRVLLALAYSRVVFRTGYTFLLRFLFFFSLHYPMDSPGGGEGE